MALWKRWQEKDAVWGIWKLEEDWTELFGQLSSPLISYNQELQALKAASRRLEYVAVRVLLSVLCGEEKQILYHVSGKPYLSDGSFRISVSHTRGYVFVGLHPEREVGVDIECISDRVVKVTSRFLRSDERAVSVPELLLHWSAKETMYKLLNESEVDFLHHLRVLPFDLQKEGRFEGREYRTPEQKSFGVHYRITDDFVCTWCVAN